MLISKEERHFSFHGAQFNLSDPRDRKFLAWVFDQFLYGEVTGIQCGHWLYRAPHLNAAAFLAKQAGEEISHVKRILRIFSLLGEKPRPAHKAIRFLASGMMGSTWGEHVAIEMALGEGLVLQAFYALADIIPDPEIERILRSATVEEERHVDFGERETLAWLQTHPGSREFLLAQGLLQLWVLKRVRKAMKKRMEKNFGKNHSVVSQFDAFYLHALKVSEIQIERLGLTRGPLGYLSRLQKLGLILSLPFRMIRAKLEPKVPLLTESYLQDPLVTAELGLPKAPARP